MKKSAVLLFTFATFTLLYTFLGASIASNRTIPARAETISLPNKINLPLIMSFDFEMLNSSLFVFSNRDLLANNQSFIYTIRGDRSDLTQITPGIFSDLSPDGTKIIYFLNEEIYLANVDGTNPTNITNHLGWDVEPDWSPDGLLIAFRTGRDGNAEIYTMQPDGSHLVNLTNHSAWDGAPDWSPDGSKIVFISDRSGSRNIFVMNADGSNPTQITNFSSSVVWVDGPAWSPDGSKIAFSADMSGTDDDILVMQSDGSNLTVLANSSSAEILPIWSPDGTMIAFSANNDADPVHKTFLMAADGSNKFQLFEGIVTNWQLLPNN